MSSVMCDVYFHQSHQRMWLQLHMKSTPWKYQINTMHRYVRHLLWDGARLETRRYNDCLMHVELYEVRCCVELYCVELYEGFVEELYECLRSDDSVGVELLYPSLCFSLSLSFFSLSRLANFPLSSRRLHSFVAQHATSNKSQDSSFYKEHLLHA